LGRATVARLSRPEEWNRALRIDDPCVTFGPVSNSLSAAVFAKPCWALSRHRYRTFGSDPGRKQL